MKPMFSIVIPTWNRCDELLKPCCESIKQHTDLSNVEVIIVANGCTDNTREYVESLGESFKLIWIPERSGYVKSTNAGIRAAEGEFLILLNNDCQLLKQPKNRWIEMLYAPFSDPKTGATAPFKNWCPYAEREFLIFFCVMIRKSLMEQIGLLDESTGEGYSEDTIACCEIADLGYNLVQVPDDSREYSAENQRTGLFPLWHRGNVSFANWPGGEELLRKNRERLRERYGKKKIDASEKPVDGIDISKALLCDGFMADEELRYLGMLAKTAKIFVECGSWHGKSTRAIADNLPVGGTLFAVDTWLGSKVERETNHASAKLKDGDHAFLEFSDNLSDHILSGRVLPLRMTSQNAAEFLAKQNIKADVVFIDAGHTCEEVKADIESWYPLVKDGGILCGHDYHNGMWVGVSRAVEERFKPEIIYSPPNTTIWAVKNRHSNFLQQKDLLKKRQIIDAFPFFNELDVLEVRLNELDSVADWFVIAEANRTHQGAKRESILNKALLTDRFRKFIPKIILVSDDLSEFDSQSDSNGNWNRERHQRDALKSAILRVGKDGDIVIISDADEVPRASALKSLVLNDVRSLEMPLHYFYLNNRSDELWREGKVVPFELFKNMTPCQVRYTQAPEIPSSGWHFSYLGSAEQVATKIKSFAHGEYNKPEFTDPAKIRERMDAGEDAFGRDSKFRVVPIDETYPRYVLDNQGKFRHLIKEKPLENGRVTATISTKDRYFTTLPLTILSLAFQTRKPDKLVIYDDGEVRDLREVPPYSGLFRLLDEKKIPWIVEVGQHRGQVANHQHALDNATTEFVWRIDDDNAPEPDALKWLLDIMSDDNIGAAATLVHHPHRVGLLPDDVDGKIEHIFDGRNIQWYKRKSRQTYDPRFDECEHLYSTFIYRTEIGRKIGGYPKLSAVGHREETIFTNKMRRAGYRLVVTEEAITWHFANPEGGIRSEKNEKLWQQDEAVFRKYLDEVGVKVKEELLIPMDNGLGDHLILKSVLDEIKVANKDKSIVISACFPEVFREDNDVRLISIAEGKQRYGNRMHDESIYVKMDSWNWRESVADAFRKVYL